MMLEIEEINLKIQNIVVQLLLYNQQVIVSICVQNVPWVFGAPIVRTSVTARNTTHSASLKQVTVGRSVQTAGGVTSVNIKVTSNCCNCLGHCVI